MRLLAVEQRRDWLARQQSWLHDVLRRGPGSPNDAEDDAQESLLRGLEATQAPASRAWLLRTARNVAIDRWRRTRRLQSLEDAVALITRAEAAGRVDLTRALDRLTAADRTLLLRIASGYSYAEIARVLGVDTAAVRKRVSRARSRLLEELR